VGVEDFYKTCDGIRSKDAKIVCEPGPMKDRGNGDRVYRRPQRYRIRDAESQIDGASRIATALDLIYDRFVFHSS
jgi:hypothetical protein